MTVCDHAHPLSDDDMIEGQKIAEAMAEQFPHEMNSHKGRLFRLLVIMVAALARDMRLRLGERLTKEG